MTPPIEPSDDETVESLSAELRRCNDAAHAAESMLTAIAAISDVHRGVDVRGAIDKLHELLQIPFRRPDAWETPHVSALDGELHELLELLGDR